MQNFLPAALSKLQFEQRIGLPTEAKRWTRSLYHAGDSKGIANQAGGKWPIQVVLGRAQQYSLQMAKVEMQMGHGFLDLQEPTSRHSRASNEATTTRNSITRTPTATSIWFA
jgi:hypothetical protein